MVAAVPADAHVSSAQDGMCVGASSPYPGGRWMPCPTLYGVDQVNHVGVTTDDGVRLDATIAYPADPATGGRAPGTFPVVLQMTPYSDQPDTFFTEHGYIAVNVRVRGTGHSGGQMDFMNARDRLDGVEAVNWAAQLPGSDGRVGLVGCSWPGTEALIVSASVGPHSPVKAAIDQCAGYESNPRESHFSGGIPTQWITAPLAVAKTSLGAQPGTVQYFEDWTSNVLSGGDHAYIGQYWETTGGATAADVTQIVRNDIPTLLWAGWSDIVETQALATYAGFQNALHHRSVFEPFDGRGASGRYQIMVGDWVHGQGRDDTLMLEWLDTFVKSQPTGMDQTATPEHLFEVGTQRWINTAAYPTVPSYTSSYLSPNATLDPSPDAATASQPLTWEQPGQPGGSLTYTTTPFARGATLSGPISATLYASSTNTNLELIPSLYDVAPDGTATFITTGTMLGSQRAYSPATSVYLNGTLVHPVITQAGDDYLTPGNAYRLEVAVVPTQWSLLPGHSLRLELTTQWPASGPSGCQQVSAPAPCDYTAPQKATLPGGVYKIFTGGADASVLHLPLAPWSAFPAAAGGVTPTSSGIIEPLDWGRA
jgi:predicted acyl esterase